MHSNEQTSLCKYRFLLRYQHNATISVLLSKTPLSLKCSPPLCLPLGWCCEQDAVLAHHPVGHADNSPKSSSSWCQLCNHRESANLPGLPQRRACPALVFSWLSGRHSATCIVNSEILSELWLGLCCFYAVQCQGGNRVVHLQIPSGNTIDPILLKWEWVSSAPHHVGVLYWRWALHISPLPNYILRLFSLSSTGTYFKYFNL